MIVMKRRTNKQQCGTGFFYFDQDNRLNIPSLELVLDRGECVSALGVKGTDVTNVYQEFYELDPLRRIQKGTPVIRCITRKGSFHHAYSAYENFFTSDQRFFPFSRKKLVEKCEEARARFGISFSFRIPIHQLSPSQRILVELMSVYLSGADYLVCDNLFSLMGIEDREIMIKMVGAMLQQKRSVLYLTTKWEFAVQLASRFIIFSDQSVLGTMDAAEVIQNPQRLVYLISGRSLMDGQSESSNTANMLSMLYAGAEYLTNNYEISDALTFVTANVNKVLACSSSSIYLFSSNRRESFRFCDAPAPVLTETFLAKFAGSTDGDKLLYASADDVSFRQMFLGGTMDMKSLLAMPIILKGNVCGVLVAYYSIPIIYDEQQFLGMRSFCREIAIIIETSRLMGNSVLLQESNHRIKNNLQVIISLLSVQQLYSQSHTSVNIQDLLESIISRVQNIATVHEMLISGDGRQHNIDLEELLQGVLRVYQRQDIRLRIDAPGILVPHNKATSISMTINELVVNSLKYAFPENWEDKRILVQCRLEDGKIRITVEDNGIGLPEDICFKKSTSIGFSIIRTLVNNDLHGVLDVENTGHGTCAHIEIPYFA